MKQISITLLVFIVTAAPCFAQVSRDSIGLHSIDSQKIETSSIMFGKNMTTGMIHVDVPADAECNINIYSPEDNKLYSSDQQRNFSLFPGMYHIEISGMMLKNIPVYKATDTRVKAGTLNITSGSHWTLFDADKVKKIYTSSLHKKVEFPSGFYQLEFNGLLHRIEIKDGETLEYNDSISKIVSTQKLNIDSNKTSQVQKLNLNDSNKALINDSNKTQSQKIKAGNLNNTKIIKPEVNNTLVDDQKWEIKKNLKSNGATGRILINIPKETECIITISNYVTGKQVAYSGALTKERSFSLVPGTFDIQISGSKVKSVPVQKAMDTRIKAGLLNVLAPGIWTLYDENKSNQIYYSSTARKIGLPIGTYQIEINGTMQKVIIKDGGVTVKF